ncbi:MAG: DUF4412 domain-containing protein [Helicobacteraceae bacterium]|jgi:hypothetical protein|nr:DUF4412 domain-containing protein [Helicobacteraceae bacterium]
MRFCVWCLSLPLAVGLNAGWAIEEVTSYAVGEKSYNRVVIDSDRYKSQNKDETLIIDLKKDTVYFVRDKEKSYFGGRVDDVIAELRKNAMTEMNEEDDILSANADTEDEQIVEIKKLKDQFTAGGFTGDKYQVFVNGELKKELFIAPKLTANAEIDSKKLNEIMLWLSGTLTPSAKNYVELSDEYVKLTRRGYPIRTIERDPGGGLIVTVVVKAEQKSFAPDEFALPSDYAKMSSEDFYKPLE